MRRFKRPGTAGLLAAMLKGAVITAPLFFSGAAPAMATGLTIPEHLEKRAFKDLDGWRSDDHLAALKSLMRFCGRPEALRKSSAFPQLRTDHLDQLCKEAAGTSLGSPAAARRFFEARFTPFRIVQPGFITGYFEPELAASRNKTSQYATPLLQKPDGLVPVTAANRPDNWPEELSHGRLIEGILSEMPDRGAIMNGALDEENLELVWLADPIDAFFVHVQGSVRLRLTDGSVMRVGYAGKTGHPYTGIARLLVKRGEGTPDEFTMAGTRAWLKENPDKRDALFRENRSYIFFREVTDIDAGDGPVGAAGLPLTAGRSLAVDPGHIPYGALVFVGSDLPDPANGTTFGRLMVADDTGSAIRGPARGDVFVGSGEAAGTYAGDIRHAADFTLLVPNALLPTDDAVTD